MAKRAKKAESETPLNAPLNQDQQMTLFSMVDLPAKQREDYSNIIDIYDAMPKYLWGRTREHKDLKNASILRQCSIRGRKLSVKLKPALIDKGDRTVLIYPGPREELVEDALRKIAVNGQGVCINKKAGVSFTLYELAQELKKMGHTYSIDEIKESLFVCRGSIIECYSEDGESVINSSLFGLMGLTTKSDLETKGRTSKCFVQFNPLVNDSIMSMSFRQYNYRLGMTIRSPFARFIYKRMAQYWTQASENHPYQPSLISFLEQSPRGLANRMSDNLRAMRAALDILQKNEVISHYVEEKLLKGKQKVIDAKYSIYPHKKFISDMISANQRKNTLKKKAIETLT